MTADETPLDNELASDIEPIEPASIIEPGPQTTTAKSSQPEARAEIVLRKHYICPYLGLSDDRTVVAMMPSPAHACYARKKRYAPSLEHQMVRCLSSNYPGCSIYPDNQQNKAQGKNLYTLDSIASEDERGWGWWLRWVGLALLALFLFGGGTYAVASGLVPVLWFQTSPTATSGTETVAPAVAAATETPTQTSIPPATLTAAAVAQAPATTATVTDRTPSPTPSVAMAEGETLTLTPNRADVGWWGSSPTQSGQIGDSFLYSGVNDQQAYLSVVRFDLSSVPRGARIEDGKVRLTGLRDDLLDRSTESTWLVQLISEGALPDLADASFFMLYEAPASFDLIPNVQSTQVGPGLVNEWTLDSATHGWLYQQMLDGATSIVVRIVPQQNNGSALFAWDSGHDSESGGALPELILSTGPVPATPPPTPTRPQIVATLTPTPENVLTVAALTPLATTQVAPTNTPVPPEIVTPTPVAMDLPAVQTAAVAEGRPPVLINTPVPANIATATTNASYATAVALTTGTFTPVPTGYVTPVLFLPPPPPENIATAAARSVAATASAQSSNPTPTRPSNAVDAIYEYATPTPANQETAAAIIADQNRRAVTTGTPTPTPWNLVVITRVPEPTPTEIPLFIPTSQLTPTPSPIPTRLFTDTDFEPFRGKILFLSDRGGAGDVWVLDPTTGEVIGTVTDKRLHSEARARFLTLSPNGREQAIVQADGDSATQIKVENFDYQTIKQLTHMADTLAYDPAWSPRGDPIAFVGTLSGGDEIYTISPNEGDPVRLTFNSWEWDKHPTWSPDGSQIAFFSNRDTGRRQIWLMNADGSNQRNLSNSDYEDWDPVWVR